MRKAYFVRWVAPDGMLKQLRGGRSIDAARAVLGAACDAESCGAEGKPVERLLHEFLADEHLPALMARLAPKVRPLANRGSGPLPAPPRRSEGLQGLRPRGSASPYNPHGP